LSGSRSRLHSPAVRSTVEENVALARRAYEVWNTGGPEAMVAHVWAPDVVFREAPEFPDTGVFRGAEAVAARMRELIVAMGHFQVNVRSLEGRGDCVLAIFDVSTEGISSGAAVSTPYFQVNRFGEGRIREFRSYLDSDQARREYERLAAPA
jgi:ketosteroid isomerase-like protein